MPWHQQLATNDRFLYCAACGATPSKSKSSRICTPSQKRRAQPFWRTAFSPNIKERRDYSCAVFNAAGEVIPLGDPMPVHLGSMPMSVRAAINACEMKADDIVMLNDPFRGGTHLPDITLVAPVCLGSGRTRPRAADRPDFYVTSRAHHADVGGTYPGSMGLCREIYQDGFWIESPGGGGWGG